MESTILHEIANFDTKAPIHMTICYDEEFDETEEIIFKTEKGIDDDINEGEVSDQLGREQHEKYVEILNNTKGLRSNYNIEQSISKKYNNDQYENLTKSGQNKSRKRKKNQSITNKNKIPNKKKNAAKTVSNTYNNENEVKTELTAVAIKSRAQSSSPSASAKLKLNHKLAKKTDTESNLPNLSSTSDQLAIKSHTEPNVPNLRSTSDQLAVKSDTESHLLNLRSTSDQLVIKSDTELNLPKLSSTSDQPNPSNLVGEKDENMKTPTCVMSLTDMRERLEFVARQIELVLEAFSIHKLHQTQSTNETFNKVKYCFFRLCYDTVARILLPSDKYRFLMKSILQKTYWRKRYPSYGHSEQDYENVFHELLMWTKYTKEKEEANRTSGERNKPVQPARPAPPNNGVEIDNSDKQSGDKICIFSSGLSGREITINIDANLNNYLETSNKCKEISGEKSHAIKINQQKSVIPLNNTSNLQSQSEHFAQFVQPKPNTMNNYQTLQQLLNQPARIPFQNNVGANNIPHDFEESIKQIEVHKAVRTQQKQGPPPYSQHPPPYPGKSHQVPPGNKHPSHVQRKCLPPYRPPPPCTPHHVSSSSDRRKEPKYDQSIPNQRQMGPSEYALFRHQQWQQVHREQFQGGQPPCQFLQHGHCQLKQSQCVVQNRQFQVPNQQSLPQLPPYETLQVEQSQCTRMSYSESQGGPPQCVQMPYGQLQAQYVGTQNSPLQPGYGTSGGQLLGRPQHAEYSIQHGQPQLQLSQPLVPQNDQTYIAPEPEKSRATQWYREPNELYNLKQMQPQIPKSSPRSASTDSGFISPLDFNASADQTAPSSSDQIEECSPFGKISHVTSLNPKVAFVDEGNCVVCNKRTKQVCMGCMQLYYCTYTCQEKDWSSHGPKCIGAIDNTAGQPHPS